MSPFSRLIVSLLAISTVSANWHTESTNSSFTPFLLRSKTLNFRGLNSFDHDLQRRQSCGIGFTTCGEGCCKIDTFCCEDKEGCCPIGYTCTPGGCCPIAKTCSGFKECPTDPTLAQCAGGEGCCPPGVLCVHDSTGATRCEGESPTLPPPPPPPAAPSNEPPESSTSSTSPSSSFSLPSIPPPPSDGSFPTFTPPPFPTGPVSGDDGNSISEDDGGLSLGGDTDGALGVRPSVMLLALVGIPLVI